MVAKPFSTKIAAAVPEGLRSAMVAPSPSVNDAPSLTVTRLTGEDSERVNVTLENSRLASPPCTVKLAFFPAVTTKGTSPSERIVVALDTMTAFVNMSAGQSLRKTISAPLV